MSISSRFEFIYISNTIMVSYSQYRNAKFFSFLDDG